jgi:hypothetical protein
MTVMMMPFCEAQAPIHHKRRAGTSTSYSKYGVFQQKFKKGSVRALFVSLSGFPDQTIQTNHLPYTCAI